MNTTYSGNANINWGSTQAVTSARAAVYNVPRSKVYATGGGDKPSVYTDEITIIADFKDIKNTSPRYTDQIKCIKCGMLSGDCVNDNVLYRMYLGNGSLLGGICKNCDETIFEYLSAAGVARAKLHITGKVTLPCPKFDIHRMINKIRLDRISKKRKQQPSSGMQGIIDNMTITQTAPIKINGGYQNVQTCQYTITSSNSSTN